MDNAIRNQEFKIKNASESFASKQKDLFDQLLNAEKLNKRILPTDNSMEVDALDKKRVKSSMKQFKRKESIFKRPEAPISRCLPHGKRPGFRKNPDRWTKYSLSDVSDEDISDRSNTRAALSFLGELETRKCSKTDEKVEALPEKIVFKKTAIINKIDDTNVELEKPVFRQSKVVMPEYVVGQKVVKEKKNKIKETKAKKSELKLNHLFEEDEEDN